MIPAYGAGSGPRPGVTSGFSADEAVSASAERPASSGSRQQEKPPDEKSPGLNR